MAPFHRAFISGLIRQGGGSSSSRSHAIMTLMQASPRVSHPVRALSAASAATFTALLSHLAGGGAAPDPLGVIVPLLLSLLVCSLLAGRRLSLPRLAISVVASQALFHGAFVLGAPGAHHHAVGAGMWIAHLGAAAVTVLFLYRGEQAILRLREVAERFVAWAAHRLDAPIAVPVARKPAEPHGDAIRRPALLSQCEGSTLTRRGPPTQRPNAR